MASTVALLSQSLAVLGGGSGSGSATVVHHSALSPPQQQELQQQQQQQQQQEQQQQQQQQQQGAAASSGTVAEHLVLRLVPKKKKNRGKAVRWAEDVVDNEFMNKKKSKKCCIFHRQRQFGEWSDEEDSDAECECGEPGSSGGDPGGEPPQAEP
ncbi:hypothetical protein ABPG77_003487 [Micractinium sp. CCAP 211/92]